MIIGGAQEEVALEKIMDEITNEVEGEQAAAQMRGEELDEAELCSRVQTKLASRGTRTRQMKHDSRMETPQADLMSGLETLDAWRKASPAPPANPERARVKKGRSKKRSGPPLAPPPTVSLSVMSSAAAPMKSMGMAATMGATSVTVEEDLISPAQVMRCMKKSAARGRKGIL